MTTYNTRNPLGSAAVKDLFDNAENLDFAVNSITQTIWNDRLGRPRKTWYGMEAAFLAQLASQEVRFNAFIERSGYQVIGDYEDGPLTITEYNQLVRYQNELWKITADTEIPFTTAGNTAESWEASDKTHFVSVGDAALRQELFVTHKLIPHVTPLMFNSLEECFSSGYETVVVPAGIYTITEKMRVDISNNLNVICQPGAVFRLADNVRDNMLVFVGNLANDFSWSGGEIDGNFDGQGGEQVDDGGLIRDVSHGLIVSMFNSCEISNLYIHDCMGHHINHGGNNYFHAHDIVIKSHISSIKPEGGARGDGITGCSKNVLIENISGFSTDDFVAVFSGIPWIEGIGYNNRQVESVIIRNIRPWFIMDPDGVTKRYTWHACTVGNTNGQKIDFVDINGVNGFLQSGGVRINAYTNMNSEYYGSFGMVNISDVSTYVKGKENGGFTDKLNAAHVCVGWSDPNSTSMTGSKLQTIDSITVSGVTMRSSPGCTAGVTLGHAQVKSAALNNITAIYENDVDFMSAINIVGQNDIDLVKINNISQQHSDSTPASVKRNRMCVTFYYGGNKNMAVYGSSISSFKNSNNYIGNTLFFSNDLYPNNVSLYGYDFVVEAQKNFASVAKQFGVYFTDRYIGRVSRTGRTGGWNFEDWYCSWDSTDFGRPSISNMPGYANITDWGEGTIVRVIGSPYHECTGWICRSNTPTWQLLSTQVADIYGDIKTSWTPVNCTPGVEFTTHISINSSDSWPVSGGGVVRTLVSTTGNGSGTLQEFIPRDLSAKYVRFFQQNSWSLFKKTPFQ